MDTHSSGLPLPLLPHDQIAATLDPPPRWAVGLSAVVIVALFALSWLVAPVVGPLPDVGGPIGELMSRIAVDAQVMRAIATAATLLSVVLLYLLAVRLTDTRTALLATVLFGTSFSTLTVARAALIEPLQLLLVIAAALCVVVSLEVKVRRYWELAALLLITGMIVIDGGVWFVLPALVLTVGLPIQRTWRELTRIGSIVAIGACIAVALRWWLHEQSASLASLQWAADLQPTGPTESTPIFHIGRIGLDPAQFDGTLTWLGTHEPLLLGLAAAGLGMAMLRQEQLLMAVWLLLGVITLTLRVDLPESARTLLIAPVCFLAAWTLSRIEVPDTSSRGRRRRGQSKQPAWTTVVVAAMVLVSATRALMATPSSSKPTTVGSSQTVPAN
ncbi:MAG: glycosyltransferase family 39 protein [Gemmatimonadaceae bacterium]|nr:glycosyltransferase family 39 protein [Gemmatimonadaceae bacterium]